MLNITSSRTINAGLLPGLIYVCVCICMWCVHVCLHAFMRVCLSLSARVFVYVCVCVCVCVCQGVCAGAGGAVGALDPGGAGQPGWAALHLHPVHQHLPAAPRRHGLHPGLLLEEDQ